jgi:mannosyl-3-phosphoglycerate phosphatase
VFCTSKTRVEVAALFARLGSRHVAIIEDGGALLVPPGTLPRITLPMGRRTAHGRLVPLTTPYRTVRRVFAELKRRTAHGVTGFGDWGTQRIALETGLSPADARRAARREFDEPFVITTDVPGAIATARRLAARRGLVITRGGRFYHLHGPTDKGRAVRLVRRLLEFRIGPVRMIALGDSPLDASFLAEAELPVLVPRPDGRPDPALLRRFPRARIAPAPGPAGWSRAVLASLAATRTAR